MHAVVETDAFLRDARSAGVSALERWSIVSWIARNPTAGDLIEGSGGARKVRFPGRGKARVADIA